MVNILKLDLKRTVVCYQLARSSNEHYYCNVGPIISTRLTIAQCKLDADKDWNYLNSQELVPRYSKLVWVYDDYVLRTAYGYSEIYTIIPIYLGSIDRLRN